MNLEHRIHSFRLLTRSIVRKVQSAICQNDTCFDIPEDFSIGTLISVSVPVSVYICI